MASSVFAALRVLPVLVFGAYGGLIADRVDKRRLLLATQTALSLLALALGLLIVTHAVRAWMVFVLAAAVGLVNAVDAPGRQAFVPEMVGRDRLQNAVSFNSVLTKRRARWAPRSRASSSPQSGSGCASL
jgi:MFS family permease